MKENMLCHIRDLSICDKSPNESIIINRENYAKQALMMFYPHRGLEDLMLRQSFWSKFVEVGGLMPFNASNDPESGKSELRKTKCLWEKGKDILHNIQARLTMEKEMKRPPDPIQLQTQKPAKTGERAKSNVDDDYNENKYDMDISDFDIGLDMIKEAQEDFLEPLSRSQLRDSDAVIERAIISKENIVDIKPESNNLLVACLGGAEETGGDANEASDRDCDKPQ